MVVLRDTRRSLLFLPPACTDCPSLLEGRTVGSVHSRCPKCEKNGTELRPVAQTGWALCGTFICPPNPSHRQRQVPKQMDMDEETLLTKLRKHLNLLSELRKLKNKLSLKDQIL